MSRIIHALSTVSKTASKNVSSAVLPQSIYRLNAAATLEATQNQFISQRLAKANPVANALEQIKNTELCAVPKKKISPHKRRLRKDGQWRAQLNKHYKVYQVCLSCGKPVEPHVLCADGKKCFSAPRL